VGEEEPTRNYIKLVVAPEVGHGMMPNIAMESQRISFLNMSGSAIDALNIVIIDCQPVNNVNPLQGRGIN